ncbi:hypothetical protein [Paractinoplanes lichenicola]|uniref:Uncharacterized protein n=1 Tax=Paractinoplanes lichenicola TaxID=2802976 RepID=A0ABS1VS62_9ACTN|nr:hypothetical protein [Actinoplanes lichenicola]MBL7256426.1 hypothetical protein [Actinoplanes lichenicola]
MKSTEILVAFSLPDSGPLGNIWRITAKKTDFYVDPLGQASVFHLSAHGPNETNPGHRFHVRVDKRAASAVHARGDLVVFNLPRKGRSFDGQKLAPGVFRVARIRWTWHLQRPRFRQAAALPGPVPDIVENQFGARLGSQLGPNEAQDLDLVLSYGEPYWPAGEQSVRDNSRLGPLRNSAGMWLTATSFRRSHMTAPAPEGLDPPLPQPGEEPNRIMGGAPAGEDDGEMYWFVETITSRQIIQASRAE